MEQDIIQIRDLGLAAALVSLEFKVINTERDNNSRIYFIFNDSKELQQVVSSLWSNTLDVKARYYFDAIKMLKSRIYGDQ